MYCFLSTVTVVIITAMVLNKVFTAFIQKPTAQSCWLKQTHSHIKNLFALGHNFSLLIQMNGREKT